MVLWSVRMPERKLSRHTEGKDCSSWWCYIIVIPGGGSSEHYNRCLLMSKSYWILNHENFIQCKICATTKISNLKHFWQLGDTYIWTSDSTHHYYMLCDVLLCLCQYHSYYTYAMSWWDAMLQHRSFPYILVTAGGLWSFSSSMVSVSGWMAHEVLTLFNVLGPY